MSSESRAPSQIPANKLYVNIAAINSTIFDGSGVATSNILPWVTSDATAAGLLSTAGMAVLRDMGKTVYLPATGAGAQYSTVLRKVQLVTPSSVGGTDTAGPSGYLTGYIQLGGMTYGGGQGFASAATAARVARLN